MVEKRFPGASHISWLNGYLLFEIPEKHLKRRSILFHEISGFTATVMDGGLTLGQKTPESADIYDNSNYRRILQPV